MSLNTQHTTNTNYNKHNFCDVPLSVKIKHHPLSARGDQGSSYGWSVKISIVLCRSFAVRDYPLSVHEDQSSSVVIHGRSVAIQYHPMSVREDQSSSFVSLHQGMRLPDKQTRYRQADKQDNKEDHKVSGFGCSEAPSAYPPTTTTSSRLPRPAGRRRRPTGDENAALVAAACCPC